MREKLTKLVARLEQYKGEVIAIAQSPNPIDSHLYIVLIRTENEYIVWSVNSNVAFDFPDCGCSSGHYYTDDKRLMAFAYFSERLRQKSSDYTASLQGL